MDIDTDKIDEAGLALLYLTLHEDHRAWKSFDWDSTNRLCEKGFISNPANKAKSVALTDKGLLESERLFKKMFVKPWGQYSIGDSPLCPRCDSSFPTAGSSLFCRVGVGVRGDIANLSSRCLDILLFRSIFYPE